jgi:hypothetical protein
MFVSWEAVALSLLPSGLAESAGPGVGAAPQLLQASLLADGAAAASGALPAQLPAAVPVVGLPVDPVEVFVRRSNPLIGSVVEGFSFLAVLTSFIGTTLSLSGESRRSDSFRPGQQRKQRKQHSWKAR